MKWNLAYSKNCFQEVSSENQNKLKGGNNLIFKDFEPPVTSPVEQVSSSETISEKCNFLFKNLINKIR